ncbi:MAG: tripartite tricarboxylate transporter TctB family protein, partial [Smithellaceae bacterium]|nr:tripartite tricarboxylate transporter TctB family protein [Smithellaceae bacterium]
QLFSVESPIIFPAILSVLLIIFIIVDWYSDRKESPSHPREGLKVEIKREYIAVLVFFVGTLTYILLLPRLHFVPGTILFMSVVAVALNTSADSRIKKIIKAVIAASILIPALYYIFSGIFFVALP